MKIVSSFSALVAIGSIAFAATAYAQATPNMAGTFRCQAEVSTCGASGNTFTVTQTGANIEVKNDKGELGNGTVTSNITISMGPPWNMLGVISDNNRQIEWSNGTKWMKQ